MQRIGTWTIVLLLFGLAGYFYCQAPVRRTVSLTETMPLAAAEPVRGVERGQGPNFALARRNFIGASWRQEGVTVVPNAATAPDGTQTADRLEETRSGGRHRIETSLTGLATGEVHTLSLYIKRGERSDVMFEMRDVTPGKYGFVKFDLRRKAVVAQSGDVSDFGVQELPTGWFRCWAAMPYATDRAVFNFALLSSAAAVEYGGDGRSGLLIWGVQFERGAKPGGYSDSEGPPAPSVVKKVD